MGDTALGPLLSLIAAYAVEQIQHGILLVLGISGRRVNLHPAVHAHGLGVVIDAFEFAVLDTLKPSEERAADPSDDLAVLEAMWREKLAAAGELYD